MGAPLRLGAAGLLFALALFGAACSSDKSYAVVTLRMSQGELTGVKRFLVYVENGPSRQKVLYFQQQEIAELRLTPTETTTLSVSFNSNYAGNLRVGVEARDSLDAVLAYGVAEKMIDPGHKIDLDVALTRGAIAPPLGSGQPDAGGEAGIPLSACMPTAPAMCGAGKTCVVDCVGTNPDGRCATGGAGKDGDACVANLDCEPGSSCIPYKCGGLCRKFCATDADCPEGVCSQRIVCGQTPTEHRYCLRSCDPRLAAPNACPGNHKCLLFVGARTACDCVPDGKRTRGDGMDCDTTEDCAPGLMCIRTTTSVCRPICKRSDPTGCEPGRICADIPDPAYATWSACIPP
jgi:hypothetical protein